MVSSKGRKPQSQVTPERVLDAHAHVTIVGPAGIGKTLLEHALGHIACRLGATVLALRTDQMLKLLKHARLDNSYEVELRKLVAVDLLILDDSTIDVLDPMRVATSTTYSSSAIALGRRSSPRTAGLTNGSPRLPIPCERRASTASPATATISSWTSSH